MIFPNIERLFFLEAVEPFNEAGEVDKLDAEGKACFDLVGVVGVVGLGVAAASAGAGAGAGESLTSGFEGAITADGTGASGTDTSFASVSVAVLVPFAETTLPLSATSGVASATRPGGGVNESTLAGVETGVWVEGSWLVSGDDIGDPG